jgi:hypothetical protein
LLSSNWSNDSFEDPGISELTHEDTISEGQTKNYVFELSCAGFENFVDQPSNKLEAAIRQIFDSIDDLGLPDDMIQILKDKLMSITKLIDDENPEVVCSNLDDFIKLVDAYRLETKLSSNQASNLIEQIKDVLQDIDCTTGLDLPQSLNSLTESIFNLPTSDISSMGQIGNSDH